jgi:YgiT-type zinc finger domain-containing protein
MIQPIRCIHCGTKTRIITQTIKSRVNRRKIALHNTPVHYCPKCDDILISLEALSVLNYIKSLPAEKIADDFDYDQLSGKAIP